MNNDLAIKQLVKRHFAELHELRAKGRLSEADHNRIGMSLANCLGDLARLSGKGWVQAGNEHRRAHDFGEA